MNINTIDLTPLFEAIIALAAAIITMYLIPWIKSKTNEQQQAYIHAAVKGAVYAAEKFYGAGNGEKKLDYAEKVLRENYGVHLDMNKLEAVIDAAIKEMEQKESGGMTIIENIGEAIAEDEEEEEEAQTKEPPEGE